MKKLSLSLLALAAAFGGPELVSAKAELPALSSIDTGPDAIVIARHLTLADESVKVRSNRIEVTLEGRPPALSTAVDDATIAELGIRIRSTGERRLTITIKGGRDTARRLARRVRVSQIGDSVQVIVARKIGVDPVAAFISDLDTDEPAGDITIDEDEVPAAAAAKTETTAKDSPEPAPEAAAAPQKSSESSSAGTIIGLLLIFAAAIVAGLGYRELQKRRTSAPAMHGIDVLSVRNIGPKTRLMLVAVGSREMLLTVGPAGSNVLGRWRRNDSVSAPEVERLEDHFPDAPLARPLATPPERAIPRQRRLPTAPPQRRANPQAARARRPDTAPGMPVARRGMARGSTQPDEAISEWGHKPTSPAIRGILELRDQTLALDDVLGQSDDEIDREWEQAIANGTRAGRLR